MMFNDEMRELYLAGRALIQEIANQFSREFDAFMRIMSKLFR